MGDRIARLESSVEQLRVEFRSLERRLAALETARTAAAPDAAAPDAAAAVAETAAPEPAPEAAAAGRGSYDPIALLTLLGRLFLVLAGGFFLRAMTEAGALAPAAGLALAALYGLLWLVMADRAGGRRQVPNAVFHALAAAMIAFPLLVEATTKFKVLTGPAGSAVLAALAAVLLFVACRRRLAAIAWIGALGTLAASVVLAVQTGAIVPFAVLLVALGLVALWLGYQLDWRGIRWPAALVANLAVAAVTLRAAAAGQQDTPQVALALQALLLAAYLASVGYRTLALGFRVTAFEALQTVAVLVVGLGGAAHLAAAAGTSPLVPGVASLLLGAACYAVAVMPLSRRAGGEVNVYFYSALGFTLLLAGIGFVLGGVWLAVVPGALAVAAVAAWARAGHVLLLLHGAAWLLVAGLVPGNFGDSGQALVVGAAGAWARPGVALLAVTAAGALSVALAARRTLAGDDWIAIVPRFVITLCFVLVAGGSIVGFLAPAVGSLPDGGVDAGVLATVRTGVLSLATLGIAWLGRRPRFREWAWLVYPLLVLTGLKMIAQDFEASRPATLFIALALYGTALIVAPRLRRAPSA